MPAPWPSIPPTAWGGRIALDLLDGRETAATRSRYVRSKPTLPPPSPCAPR